MGKILLLEDDFNLANGLRFALEKQGYEVDEKRTIAEAKNAWPGGAYDLLILDVSLPDGNGFDFCRSVRQSSEVPIIFLTASDEEMNVIMGLDIGGDDYVTLFLQAVRLLQKRRTAGRFISISISKFDENKRFSMKFSFRRRTCCAEVRSSFCGILLGLQHNLM